MKIAIYHNLMSGGAKRTLHEQVCRLSTRHQLDVYTLGSANHEFADLRPFVSNHKIFDFEETSGFSTPFGRLNPVLRLFDLYRLRALNQRIANIIDQGNYDVVYVQPCRFENCPSILRFLSQQPSFYFCHEPLRLVYEEMPYRHYERSESLHRHILNKVDPLPASYFEILKRGDRQNIQQADVILVNSIFTRNLVQSIYGLEAIVSYQGVNTSLFRPLNLQRRKMVVSVGSLTPLKGFDFLIRSLAHIPVHQRPRLVIVSNFEIREEREYLHGLAKEREVEVEFLSRVSDKELVKYYNQAALTVYAPIREPFGLVAIESMACCTPIVAVDEGGIQETVVHGGVGLLVERDEEEFAQAITSLLQNPELASAYGINGRREVEQKWTWDRAVDRIESALDEAARQFPRASSNN